MDTEGDYTNPTRKPDKAEIGALIWFTYVLTIYGLAAAGCLCIWHHIPGG